MTVQTKCPVLGGNSDQRAVGSIANQHWWPNKINLRILHQNPLSGNPMGKDFDYAKEFLSLDLDLVREDLYALMKKSEEWWPADYGHYGPFFIRMAWHSAGTYRIGDGRGGAGAGTLRFAPLNSWPDNGNLDKARKLLWPIKQKYGSKISWADLMILTGNCALESMGFETFGFAGGREDIWEPEEDIYWGSETEWLGDSRYSGERDLEKPLGAVQMGLIYVNPEGPNGDPDPLASAIDIRETFGRMAMNDEETVALIAGGHTFGKGHGAADPDKYVGPEPEGASIAEQGTGWKNNFGTGVGVDTITSGLEGAWTTNPIAWDNNYFNNLFSYEWKKTKSPAGAVQWVPTDMAASESVPDAHNPKIKHAPIMFTTDLALKVDPLYYSISKRFHEQPKEFAEAFSKAWFKLTHRDMGPYKRGLGSLVPDKPQIWQDPIPEPSYELIGDEEINSLKEKISLSGLTVAEMVYTAWASAATFRGTDKRGGANGARIRLSPQKEWEVNQPDSLKRVLGIYENLQTNFNQNNTTGKEVSLADLIILGGNVAIEKAAKNANVNLSVSFMPGRADALQKDTDTESFNVLEPISDGFRNYAGNNNQRSKTDLLIDRAHLLTLTAPEMTVLIGGLRVLGSNFDNLSHGVLTKNHETLDNEFFVNLLDNSVTWSQSADDSEIFEGRNYGSSEVIWTGTEVDLIFGSDSQLRAISEVYASADSKKKFIDDFVVAWSKVMNLDRFEIVA
jgi:catalase-peroxidase